MDVMPDVHLLRIGTGLAPAGATCGQPRAQRAVPPRPRTIHGLCVRMSQACLSHLQGRGLRARIKPSAALQRF